MGRRVVAVLALCLLWAGCDGNDAESEQSAVTDSSGAPGEVSVDAVAEVSCLPLALDGWSRPAGFAGADDGVKLASDGETMLAMGVSAGGVVGYHSSDGLVWEPSEDLPEMWVGGPIIDVAGGPMGFVAVGTVNPQDTQHGLVTTPVVAYSPDGTSWERIDSETLPEFELRWFSGVFAGPEGFILVGTDADPARLSTFVWHSDDGTTWSDTDLDLGEGPVAVTATEEGWMLLSADDADWPTDAPSRMWTSDNGANWTEFEVERPAPARALFRYLGTAPLLHHNGTLVLVLAGATAGDPDPRSPTVWTSTDGGTTWSEHTVWDDPDHAGFDIRDTAVIESGLLLVGYQDRPGQPGVEFVHHSADGISWNHCWTDPVEFLATEPLGDTLVAATGTGIASRWTDR
jgi:hypothetical protein